MGAEKRKGEEGEATVVVQGVHTLMGASAGGVGSAR